MLTLPLFQSGSGPTLTPMEQAVWNSEQLITALMMMATLREDLDDNEREIYTLLSVATVNPAEA